MPDYDFFLSHNRAENDWTRSLNESLRELGTTTFFDEESIAFGEDIVTAIGEALRGSKHLVFVLSRRSVASPWVALEWTSAIYTDPDAQARRVVPILKEDCEIPFLLKRLRRIDARHSTVAEVASSLMSVLSRDSPPPKQDAEASKAVETHGPLRFGSPQYVRRLTDSRLEEGLRRGEAVIIYGPRMFGKTSMLVQAGHTATLRGSSVVWLDLQAHLTDDADIFIETVGHDVALRLGEQWDTSDLPPIARLRRLLAKWASKNERPAVLLIDEYDVMSYRPAGSAFANLLHAVLSDPSMRNLSCVAAGLYPPWMLDVPDAISPWWTLFHLERISHFDAEQVSAFCTWLGGGAEQHADKLFEVTGGHPALVAMAGYEHSSGHEMAEILNDPSKPDGPFFPIAWMTVKSAVRLLKDRRNTLASVRDGGKVPRPEELEALWLMGLVKSPAENPPMIRGSIFRDLIPRLIEEEA